MAARLHHRGIALAFGLLALAGCQGNDLDSKPGTVFEADIFGDLAPRGEHNATNQTDSGENSLQRRRGGLAQNFGTEAGGSAPAGTRETATGGQFTLNYENTDIKEVIRAVLNDALGVNYTIAGDVAGPVTLSSARPVGRDALLSILESSLSSFGFTLSKSGDGYRVAATSSGGTVDVGRRTSAGFGVSVIPLRFVAASAMVELLSGFVAQDGGVRIGVAGNSIIARGPGPQRAEVVDAVLSFDSDFMQDQSVSIFRLSQARPEDVVPELERIFNADGASTLIHFRPVSRLRGVMVISKNSALIRRAEVWVRRLDQQDSDTGQNVVVYKAKYRKATELARVMNNLFGGGSADVTGATRSRARGADDGGESDPGFAGATDRQSGDEAEAVFPTRADVRVASAFDEPAAGGQNGGGQENTIFGVGPNVVDLTTAGQTGAMPIRISADPSNNSVVIYGDAERASQIMATLKRLDATPLQVAVNVTIAEVRLTNELKYGVQYFITSRRLGLGTDDGSISLIDQASNVLKSQIPGLNFVLGANANPDIIISALDVIGDVEVLSSPSLVVLENQTATLQVGDEVPITTRQSQSIESDLAPVINQVEFKNTGIILNVTPRIGQNDAVTMKIEQEISNVASGADTLTPTISKRRIQSEISVNDQQTVLLGGLISESTEDGKKGIPGLMRVPFIGDLFATNTKNRNRTELIVLIRPVIIRDGQDAARVAESLRASMFVMGSRKTPLK